MPEKPVSPPSDEKEPAPPAGEIRVVNAEDLFRGEREICIDHGGVCYRLRITRRNRLILQK